MPCRDDFPPSADEIRAENRRRSLPPAVLCAILTVLENEGRLPEFLDKLNWKESGVARGELIEWWKEHKREDAIRRAREEAVARREELKQKALSKLTPAEREVLGHE